MIFLLFIAQVQRLSANLLDRIQCRGIGIMLSRVLCLLPELIIYMNLTLKIFHRKLGLMGVLCHCFAILIDHNK